MQILTHGLLNLPLWGDILLALGMIHLTIVSVTLYLHRAATHRGLDLHPLVSHAMRLWLWLSTGMLTKEWVAVHRKHHAHCETSDDPHSPKTRGLRKVMFEGAELYREAARDPGMLEKYGRGTPDDWMERRVYSAHSKLGVGTLLVTDVLLMGPIGLTIWAVQMIAIPFLAAGVVNGLGHHSGYRNFECKDAARNVVPWGFVLAGEELHNNHHAFPSSAKFALRPWEVDMGWWYIQAMSWLGLARVRRLAPTPCMAAKPDQVTLDTVRAVIVNRLHVLRAYSREVTRPVLQQERRAASASRHRLLAGTRRLMIRDRDLLNTDERRHLRVALGRCDRLEVVYEFRLKLEKLWESNSPNNEKLLQHFKEWCSQAEATGIASLQEFSRSLRGYTMQPA